MNWHEEVLDAAGRAAVKRLASALSPSFYLAGGTALALRLGHRISLDLGLFSRDDALDQAQQEVLLEKLKASGGLTVREHQDGTCHLSLGRTAVSLLRYRYPLLYPAASWKGLKIASLEDIAAMKLSAVVGRGSKKDFLDLYVLSQSFGLSRLLSFGERKYRDHADFPLQAARALVYFNDAEPEPMPRLLKKLPWDGIKAYFEKEVPKAVRREIN